MHLVDCFVDVFTFVRQLTTADKEAMSDTRVRQRLDELLATKAHLAQEGGYQSHHYDDAKFAVIAWVDEKIIGSDLPIKDQWRRELAQKHYFNTVKGGQIFFTKLSALDQFDAFEMDVREVFFYCLAFGFHGKYYTEAGVQELAAIRKANYQLLMQNQGVVDTKAMWFSQNPIAEGDAATAAKPQGLALMYGVPLLVVTVLIAWMRVDLLGLIESLIKAL
ncbi:DotU family type IV/VI secretion system protein [Reinekea sp.]|uniref:DotU family type IV/VI secretion system protein n=1 Tax=Reinekea sp. TaxID=1970455 RepID=UPI002A7ED370|nr:DotU family type IV/VI secretion system protein [Reinekea sp.]